MDSDRDPIIIIGAGGHARAVLEVIRSMASFEPLGILDIEPPVNGETIGDTKVIGHAEDVASWESKCRFVALAIGDNKLRLQWAEKVKKLKYSLPVLIHSHAIVDPSALIGDGTLVCAGSIICADATIGSYSIINTGVQIDHECVLGNGVHIAPGSLIGGRVHVNEGAFVGIGSVVKDKITIGSWATIGAGSVVINNIPSQKTAFGVPAKVRQR